MNRTYLQVCKNHDYNIIQKVISCRLLVYYIYNYVDNHSNFQHKLT